MIHPEIVALIIKGWLDNNSELLLSASMINFSVLAKCKIVSVEGGRVVLWSVPDGAVFTFSVENPQLSVRYSEPRDFSEEPGLLDSIPEGKQLNSALVISLPLKAIDSTSRGLDFNVEIIKLLEM